MIRGLLGLAACLVAWQCVVAVPGVVDTAIVPSAVSVLTAVGELFATPVFWTDSAATLLAWMIVLGFTVAIAVPLGLLLGSAQALRAAVTPVIELIRPLPAVALVPLVTLLVGHGAQVKITLATVAALWPTLLHTLRAVGEVDPLHRDTARAFRIPRWRQVLTVTLPSAAPFVLTGVRLSAAVGLVVLVSVEFTVGGGLGVGQHVSTAGRATGRMDIVLAAAMITGAAGFGVNVLLLAAQRRWLHWAPAGAST